MPVELLPFSIDEHLVKTVDVLLRVRTSDPTYPPPVDVDFTAEAFGDWLLGDPVLSRWVAVSNGRVVGHVALSEPHAYMVKFTATIDYRPSSGVGFAEVAKLFVDPSTQNLGIGKLLFGHARSRSWAAELQPILAVVSGSQRARKLYASEGMRELGTFEGVHGTNHVFTDEVSPQ